MAALFFLVCFIVMWTTQSVTHIPTVTRLAALTATIHRTGATDSTPALNWQVDDTLTRCILTIPRVPHV